MGDAAAAMPDLPATVHQAPPPAAPQPAAAANRKSSRPRASRTNNNFPNFPPVINLPGAIIRNIDPYQGGPFDMWHRPGRNHYNDLPPYHRHRHEYRDRNDYNYDRYGNRKGDAYVYDRYRNKKQAARNRYPRRSRYYDAPPEVFAGHAHPQMLGGRLHDYFGMGRKQMTLTPADIFGVPPSKKAAVKSKKTSKKKSTKGAKRSSRSGNGTSVNRKLEELRRAMDTLAERARRRL